MGSAPRDEAGEGRPAGRLPDRLVAQIEAQSDLIVGLIVQRGVDGLDRKSVV